MMLVKKKGKLIQSKSLLKRNSDEKNIKDIK